MGIQGQEHKSVPTTICDSFYWWIKLIKTTGDNEGNFQHSAHHPGQLRAGQGGDVGAAPKGRHGTLAGEWGDQSILLHNRSKVCKNTNIPRGLFFLPRVLYSKCPQLPLGVCSPVYVMQVRSPTSSPPPLGCGLD